MIALLPMLARLGGRATLPALLGLLALAALFGVGWRWQVLADRATAAEAARRQWEAAAHEAGRALDAAVRIHRQQMAAVAAEAAAERDRAATLAGQIEELRDDPGYGLDADGVLRRAVERLRRNRAGAAGDAGGADPAAGAPAALRGSAAPAGDARAEPGRGGGTGDAP